MTTPTTPSDTLVGLKAIAAYLSVSEEAVSRRVAQGGLPTKMIDGRVTALESDLQRWVAERQREALAARPPSPGAKYAHLLPSARRSS
jgi:hypothetical protein